MFMKLVNPAGRGSRKSRRAKHRRRKARARNPLFKKKAHRRHKRRAGRRSNPFALIRKRHGRRAGRRRNPIGAIGQDVMNNLTDGFLGGIGALGLDFGLAYLPLPTMLQTGPLNYAAKGGVAIGLGLAAEKLLGSARGKAVAQGALTVAFHEVFRAGIKQVAPTVDAKLGDAAYYNPAPIVGMLRQNRGGTYGGHPVLPFSPAVHGLGDLRDGHGRTVNGLQPLSGLDGLSYATRQLAPGA